uniref:N-alpha-acetyltransferase 15, NatA auxiliary subunit a n=1 Tax=Petromyzon marinus TaxID=7757 RepID=S4RLR8_PETMA
SPSLCLPLRVSQKCYEKTQYRLGLKFCNQILAKPQLAEHGETLALKALALSKLGRRDEARECVRRGLRNNLESHVCSWRVYGSLQRADGHYVEAAACVRRALGGCGQEGETRLLEELATLQLLASDLAGFRESQARLLHSLPSVPASWLGYAVACHLLGEPAAALQALQDLLTRHPVPRVMGDARGNQHSELMLYQAELMAEAGMRREALTHLAQYSERICDKQALDEHRGELLLALGCLEEAAELFHGLVMRNPENWTYYQRLEQATHAESEEDRWKIYQHVMKIHPSASAPQRLPLNFLTGTRFRDSMDRFLRQHLSVCCPPLFTTIKGLYRDPDKVLAIEELAVAYETSLENYGLFHRDDDGEPQHEPTLLWVRFLLAQHYDLVGQSSLAFDYINGCLAAFPCSPELLVAKASIYKHAGDAVAAAECLRQALGLEPGDRFLQVKRIKYLLRAGLVTQALLNCIQKWQESGFVQEGPGEPQPLWFLLALAEAYWRQGRHRDALRVCRQVEKHFNDVAASQLDFHTYCLRRATLRAYAGMLRTSTALRGHPASVRAARTAVRCCLGLHDRPSAPIRHAEDGGRQARDVGGSAPAAEQRKQQSKRRKAVARILRGDGGGGGRAGSGPDPDVRDGKELHDFMEELGVQEKLSKDADDPLSEAVSFLAPLENFAANDIATHLLAFEIHLRRGKPLLMLCSVRRAATIDPHDPWLHTCLVRLCTAAEGVLSTTAPVAEVLRQELPPLLGAGSLEQMNGDFLQRNATSLRHSLAGARMLFFLDKAHQDKALAIATNLDEALTDRNVATCTSVLEALRDGSLGCAEAQAETYRATCHKLFPFASAFRP